MYSNKMGKVVSIGCVIALTGCATVQDHEREIELSQEELSTYLGDKPADFHEHYTVLKKQGKRNAVLNHMRIGLAQLEIGEQDLAAQSFDYALDEIA